MGDLKKSKKQNKHCTSLDYTWFEIVAIWVSLVLPLVFTWACLMLQEPGTEAEIKEFAKGYNAEFDLFSKIDVNGDNAHPLWKWMKVQSKGKGFLTK